MTHPTNLGQLHTELLEFGDSLAIGNQQLLAVLAGGTVAGAVTMAADLSEGMRNVIRHMHASVNAGELVFIDELKTLAFISDTVHALTRSADLAMTRAGKEDAQ